MSHFTTIQTQIRDLDALQDACAELDLELQPRADCRGYGGLVRKAPHVIKLKGPYDIAVEPSEAKDGSYGLTTDWWDGHVAKEVGPGYGRLLQGYGVAKTLREARKRGLRTTRRVEADGSILLTLEGGSL
ncbi:DUF1257 domain-containing protein [Roseibacillus ishigakijimensis]|uniref:DUF1257 domain-containing protein n=1 Tax=Roseibacillus ishigakijimensis TaxID=454146 RepID=A0A934RQI4_9BACT|nr:DUF1257 domain-containing protein [Roseibacillus ishigakijimensis]MBK1835634.1 DUF1257 domain-containing protein [Roseibacillus ishigakijimensis]